MALLFMRRNKPLLFLSVYAIALVASTRAFVILRGK